ncbi:hypothetical protein [Acinetobacter towneri]|nr:hypothetical protein [Acinetobacter towneri]MCO8047146.1 hypothetical protein [Acinetobacter towneri]
MLVRGIDIAMDTQFLNSGIFTANIDIAFADRGIGRTAVTVFILLW